MCEPAIVLKGRSPAQQPTPKTLANAQIKLGFAGRKDAFGSVCLPVNCSGNITRINSWGEVMTDIPFSSLKDISNGENIKLRFGRDGSEDVVRVATLISVVNTRFLSGRHGIQCIEENGLLKLSTNTGVAVRKLGISNIDPLTESLLNIRFV